jgi:DNA-binding transcriptional LysR family regulator
LPEFRTRWWFRKEGIEPFEVPVSGNLLVANALSLHRSAANGLGPALLANWLVASDIEHGTLIDVFPGYECTATEFETAAWALYPSRSYLPQKVRVMIDYLRQML